MLVEERTYVLHAGVKLADYLECYETIGLPAQKPILGGFLGYFVTEFGTLNQLTHLWAYHDLEDRRLRRAKLAENEQWLQCLEVIRPMIKTMEKKIMYPTSFSPIRTLPITLGEPDTALHTDV